MKHIVGLLVLLLSFNIVFNQEVEAEAEAHLNDADLPSPVFDPNALNYDQSVHPELEAPKEDKQPVEDDAQADSVEADKSGVKSDESVNDNQDASADETTTVSYTTTDSYTTTTPSYSTESYSTTPSYTTTSESYSTTQLYSTTPSYETTTNSYSTTPLYSTTASYSTNASVYTQAVCCSKLFRLSCCQVNVINRPPAVPKLLPDWRLMGKTLKSVFLMPLKVALTSGMYGSAVPAASSVKGAGLSSLVAAPLILGSAASGPAASSFIAGKFALPALLFNKYRPSVQYADSREVDPSILDNFLLSQGVVSKRSLGSLVRPLESLISQNWNTAESYVRQNGLLNELIPITERLRENLSAGQSLLTQNLGESRNLLSSAVESARNFLTQNANTANSALNSNFNSLSSSLSDNVNALSSSFNNNLKSLSSAINDNLQTTTYNLSPQVESVETANEIADPVESQVLTSAQAAN